MKLTWTLKETKFADLPGPVTWLDARVTDSCGLWVRSLHLGEGRGAGWIISSGLEWDGTKMRWRPARVYATLAAAKRAAVKKRLREAREIVAQEQAVILRLETYR